MPPKVHKAVAEKVAAVRAAGNAKKNSVVIPSRSELAAALLTQFNHEMKGRAEIVRASELSLPYITKRVPTGILSIDLELRGGFPCAGLSQVVGEKNVGKSYLYWQALRQLQAFLGQKMMALLAMTELRADKTQGRLAGAQVALSDEDITLLNEARMKNGWPAFTPEEVAAYKTEIGTIHEMHAESAELLFGGILSAVEQNIYHLVVLDSVASLMSEQEAQNEYGEKTFAGASKPITEFLRKLTAMLTMRDKYGRTRDTCIIVINQIRDAIGDPNKEWRSTGGKALEHAKFVDLFLRRGKLLGDYEKLYGTDGTASKFVSWGKEIHWEILKGKAGIHDGGRGTFVFDHRLGGIDFALDTLICGVRYGIIEQAGAWLGIPDPEAPGKYMVRTQGKDAFIAMLRQDAIESAKTGEESWMNYIRSECFKKADINVTYKWE